MSDIQSIKKFLSEIEVLKRVRHEGFRYSGVDNPPSIGNHSVVAAQIAFVLAELEGADPFKAACINLFDDNAEVRISDLTKVNSRYIEKDEGEEKAMQDQLANLPQQTAEKIHALFEEIETRSTKEGRIAKDADWLESAIQSKIFVETGYKGSQDIVNNVEKALETESAKQILQAVINDPDFTNCWYEGLKKMTYKKLDS
jgi:putative hydrolase of HD superfamily